MRIFASLVNTTVSCVMTDPRNISIHDYTYSLPEERIAKYPPSQRDDSKLLINEQGHITEDVYRNITDHLPGDSYIIFNNTRVVEARLLFQKQTGGVIELFCLEHAGQFSDITSAMLQKHKVQWQCLIGGASKWKHGQILEKKIKIPDGELILRADYIEKTTTHFTIEFSWTPVELSFAEVLHYAGVMPLPPYIKREAEKEDAERYQTVYANYEGSVAAPTAGLHFTKSIFEELERKNIRSDYVTLHVGAGTFKPVKSDKMAGHEMHGEYFEVPRFVIENILENLDKKKTVAVGTTTLRTIESLYWMGMKQSGVGSRESGVENPIVEELGQWEAYELEKYNVPVQDALQTLLKWMDINKMEKLRGKTQLLIVPGYSFKIVNGLVTNFHQPQSTLLLLVAAFIGEDWRKVYEYALKNSFRFLSYGDGCLFWRS